MKSKREKIIQFLEWKSEELDVHLQRLGQDPVKLFQRDVDAQDIMEMPLETIGRIIDVLRDIDKYSISDANLCPWCIQRRDDCSGCLYGERHGDCNELLSNYDRLISRSEEYAGEVVESLLGVDSIKQFLTNLLGDK